MNLQAQLDDLQDRVVAALRHLPGATALYIFGSRSTAHADGYADIDLQLYTATFPTAQSVWPHFLTRVGPLEFAWPLDAATDTATYSVLFREESYYHKVDISLCAGDPPPNDSRGVNGEALTPLWTQLSAPNIQATPSTALYIPPIGSIGHMVLDELIASVRYIKARKRGHDLTCWRFVRAKPERLLRLIAEQTHGWQLADHPLTTWEYKALDMNLEPALRAAVLERMNWADAHAMDASCYWFTQQIIQLARQKAQTLNETIPEHIIDRHLAFMRTELHLQHI